ncbi:MAG: hypothetical protein AUI93_05185 [Crenarchaeota archaeon 13_1_40CM_3_52_10]|nr:MAG: hypothetical protein AUI93_05185 [Crenarchaeota archaeon 13_1_40CM_3_52_10]
MRKNILAGGVTLLAVAIIFGLSYPDGLLFSLPLAVLNIILGLVTKAPPGLEVQPRTGGIRLVIDRGVVRASIYQLVFTDFKLVLKRLSSANVTIILPLMLAVLGFLFLFIIGALIGGITGFSLQEFLTQRMRNKVENEAALTAVGPGDIEVRYDDLSEIRLAKNRLFLLSETNSFAASLPRRYSGRISPVLAKIFGSKFRAEESLGAAEAAEKEDEKRQHPRSDRGKFSRR